MPCHPAPGGEGQRSSLHTPISLQTTLIFAFFNHYFCVLFHHRQPTFAPNRRGYRPAGKPLAQWMPLRFFSHLNHFAMTAEELLAAYAAGERDFSGADLSGANLEGADLRKARLNSTNRMKAERGGAIL